MGFVGGGPRTSALALVLRGEDGDSSAAGGLHPGSAVAVPALELDAQPVGTGVVDEPEALGADCSAAGSASPPPATPRPAREITVHTRVAHTATTTTQATTASATSRRALMPSSSHRNVLTTERRHAR